MSALFTSARLGGLTLSNRIVVSPMCQFAARHGVASAWHRQHLGALSQSGAGLVIVESTAVSADGRISQGCLSLYDDAQEAALSELLADLRTYSTVPMGIQLAHAGRKGSVGLPWEGEQPLQPEGGGWPLIAPSAIPFSSDRAAPREATQADLDAIVASYAQAATRAVRAGFALLELHAAHGYLLHQFLSPLSNLRADRYGTRADVRFAFPLEVFRAVRAAVPSRLALGVRVSGTDWHPEGLGLPEAVAFAQALEAEGVDYLCVSSGGLVPSVPIPSVPSYQVPFAEAVKQHVRVPVMAVGMISQPAQAERLIAQERADLVALARAFLDHPRWAWSAARLLGVTLPYPPRYQAVAPQAWSALTDEQT